MDCYLIIWFIVASIVASAPSICVKTYVDDNNMCWLLLALISYAFAIYSYIQIFRKGDIIIMYPIIKVLSILIVLFAGIMMFESKCNTNVILGIIFGIISIILLSYPEKDENN